MAQWAGVKTRLINYPLLEQFRLVRWPFLQCLDGESMIERTLRDTVVVGVDAGGERGFEFCPRFQARLASVWSA